MNITGNGHHLINSFNGLSKSELGTSIIYIDGALGAATATLSYLTAGGSFVPLTDGALTPGTQYKVEHGNRDIFLVVASADGSTDFNVFATGLE